MTDPQIDLSIIIASYNTCDLLQQCLESIYQFTKEISFEIICIDDNSPDGSAEMVEQLFPEVVLLRNTVRLLYARNHNIGIKLARGRYACHLDSDTLLTGNAMAALVHFMDAHPEAAACGPQLLNGDGTVQHCIRSFAGAGTFLLQALNWHRFFPSSRLMNRYYNADFDYSRAQQVQSIGTSAYIVRRSVWESVGLFDERFGQFMVDLAYNFTLNRRGCSVWYTPCAEIVHYGSRSIGQNPEASLRDETKAFILFNEFYGYFRQDWISRKMVRVALKARLFGRLLEQRIRADKSVIKGPVAAHQRRTETTPNISPRDFPGRSGAAYEVRADLFQ